MLIIIQIPDIIIINEVDVFKFKAICRDQFVELLVERLSPIGFFRDSEQTSGWKEP